MLKYSIPYSLLRTVRNVLIPEQKKRESKINKLAEFLIESFQYFLQTGICKIVRVCSAKDLSKMRR